jgi:thiol:disulfide interchange protein DsbD
MITADEQILTRPKFYTPDAAAFADWLACGLAAYRKLP